MQIYYGRSDISLEGFNRLSQYDTYDSSNQDFATTQSDGILDEFEIEQAGGLEKLVKELAAYGVGFAARVTDNDYEAVTILSADHFEGINKTYPEITVYNSCYFYPGYQQNRSEDVDENCNKTLLKWQLVEVPKMLEDGYECETTILDHHRYTRSTATIVCKGTPTFEYYKEILQHP